MFLMISPNMLKTYELCPRKFYLRYVKNISMPVNDDIFEFGKNIHALASYYLRGENIDKMELSLSEREAAVWNYLKGIKYFGYEVVNTEYNLSLKLGDAFFGGRLDALVKEDDTYYILDYKTGSAPKNAKFDYQTMIYLLAVSKFFKTDKVKFIYIDLKNKEEEFNQLKGFVQNKKALESQLISKKDDIGVSLNQIEILKNKIEASVYDKEKYEKVIYFYEVYERRYDEFAGELSEIKGQAKELIANVNVLAEKILTNYKFQQEYKNTTDYIDLLNHIRTLYSKNGIQKELRNRSRPVIQKYTKDFFDEFNFNYSDLTLDEDYEVTVFGPEGEASMSMVSGGEKIAIALALRLGITKAKAKGDLETILLDEPTIHLDSFRRHELINLLKDMTVLPQMIIVTHESQLENAADNLVKVEKNNGISKVSN